MSTRRSRSKKQDEDAELAAFELAARRAALLADNLADSSPNDDIGCYHVYFFEYLYFNLQEMVPNLLLILAVILLVCYFLAYYFI
jgi:hypothetical protein